MEQRVIDEIIALIGDEKVRVSEPMKELEALVLRKVLAVYPQAKVKPVTGGLLLLGSPPPILPRSS